MKKSNRYLLWILVAILVIIGIFFMYRRYREGFYGDCACMNNALLSTSVNECFLFCKYCGPTCGAQCQRFCLDKFGNSTVDCSQQLCIQQVIANHDPTGCDKCPTECQPYCKSSFAQVYKAPNQ